MDICYIEKLQPELLLAIFEDVAASAPSINHLGDLLSCILVSRRWHALGLGLLWESRHISFRFGKEKTVTPVFSREFLRSDLFDFKTALAYLGMPHGTPESLNEPLLFRTRFLHLYLSDRKVSAEEKLTWPIILAIISRCSKIRHFELIISFTNNCSRRSLALQSDLATHLSGRTFETFKLTVDAYCDNNDAENTYEYDTYVRHLRVRHRR